MNRRKMREHCFKMLFGACFYPADETTEQLEQYFCSPPAEEESADGEVFTVHQVEDAAKYRDFLVSRVSTMLEKLPDIDQRIDAAAMGWKTRRMGRVELCILRQAVFEMEHDDEVPVKVAINEAVELARKFGGDESPAFVNGVLAKVLELKEEG